MDPSTQPVLLIIAAAIGIVAALAILRRQRKEVEADQAARDTPFATSTEGMKRCPTCGVASLVTDATCSACGRRLA
jgi:hypothetical protein